jgi:hypothetical protein
MGSVSSGFGFAERFYHTPAIQRTLQDHHRPRDARKYSAVPATIVHIRDSQGRVSSPKLLLTPDRVRGLLHGLMKRQAEKNVDLVDRLTALRGKLADAENRLKRFYEHIEAGSLDSSDPPLKDRVAVAKKERDIAQVTLDRAAG